MYNIYLDNASTSFPKPRAVADAMYEYMTAVGSSIGRSTAASAMRAEEAVFDIRQLLCDFFQAEDAKNVVFTKNITEALNVLIKGYLRPGDHVLVSAVEHNAVMRPLCQIGEELTPANANSHSITFTRIPVDSEGSLLSQQLPQLVRPNTKAIIMTHASNVCGTLLPIAEVGEFCHKHGLKFIVDSAQTAGLFPISMQAMHIDALAFTGHKGLLGPQGIGGFILRESMVKSVAPFITGGTGSRSNSEKMPLFMPDKFEAGTLNLPGIIGLGAALRWLQQKDISQLRRQELLLTQKFLDGLKALELTHYLSIIGKRDSLGRTSVISITMPRQDPSIIAFTLAEKYGIATRVGLHCAPSAHKALGTYPTGTLRFSLGWSTSEQDIAAALHALQSILR